MKKNQNKEGSKEKREGEREKRETERDAQCLPLSGGGKRGAFAVNISEWGDL